MDQIVPSLERMRKHHGIGILVDSDPVRRERVRHRSRCERRSKLRCVHRERLMMEREESNWLSVEDPRTRVHLSHVPLCVYAREAIEKFLLVVLRD